MLSKAISITSQAFTGKSDKAGQPYILHCIIFMTFISITSVMHYWKWFMLNFFKLSNGQSWGLGLLGIILTCICIFAVPYVMEEVIKDRD
jgi:hypothetical protein